MTNFLTARLCASLLALGLLVVRTPAAEVVPVLQTKTDTYENVTVISRTATHVFVQHAGGVANIKLSALNAQALTALGYRSTDGAIQLAGATNSAEAPTAMTANSTNRFAAFTAALSASLKNLKTRLAPGAQIPNLKSINQTVALAVLGGFALVYLFFCYCSMLICKKTANEPGLLIWLPVLQVFPLLKAAGMSGWWFLLMCVPGVNLVAQVMWCVKIAAARGKGTFTAILLILPGTNFFAYLYLAFSDSAGAAAEAGPAKSLQTEPLPA